MALVLPGLRPRGRNGKAMNIEKVKKLKPIDRLIYWIKERESVRLLKEANAAKPWTDDTILQQYRFCNVRREDDKVTRWIAKHWRNPHKNEPDLWFAMVVARLFNLPDTLLEIGFPIVNSRFPYNDIRWTVHHRRQEGYTVFNGAYIVSTNGRAMDKVDYVLDHVLRPLWENRKKFRPCHPISLNAWHTSLEAANGLGSFMAAQVVADMKYVAPLNKAHDWHTFAASGPGSRRGLNRVLGNDPQNPWREADWRSKLSELRETVNAHLAKTLHVTLHAQDLQNCLCEIDKYNRVLFGEGRPKQKYPGV